MPSLNVIEANEGPSKIQVSPWSVVASCAIWSMSFTILTYLILREGTPLWEALAIAAGAQLGMTLGLLLCLVVVAIVLAVGFLAISSILIVGVLVLIGIFSVMQARQSRGAAP